MRGHVAGWCPCPANHAGLPHQQRVGQPRLLGASRPARPPRQGLAPATAAAPAHAPSCRRCATQAYIGFVVVALFVLRVFVEKKYATRFSWVYLTESALVGSISTVAARAFSSMTMPGVAAASGTPSGCPGQSRLVCNLAGPYCWTTWSSLVLLVLGASSSLVLQNKAMMHFGNSEVVPIYFCLFTVGGVLGAAMAYDELCWPWVLLFVPGLGLCMVGVFAITYRRQNRLAAHQLSNAALQNGDGGPDGEVDDVRASNMSHASAFDEAESLLTLGGASMSSTANIMALHKPPSTPTAESLLPGGGGNSPRR